MQTQFLLPDHPEVFIGSNQTVNGKPMGATNCLHQDIDLGSGWGERGKRSHVASASPGLAAKVLFHGLYPFDEGQVRIWPTHAPTANTPSMCCAGCVGNFPTRS